MMKRWSGSSSNISKALPAIRWFFPGKGASRLCAGLDFFRKVVSLQKTYAKPGQKIDNDLQTNGTLLTDEWCEFLKANRLLHPVPFFKSAHVGEY
jgi:hypothetical protein